MQEHQPFSKLGYLFYTLGAARSFPLDIDTWMLGFKLGFKFLERFAQTSRMENFQNSSSTCRSVSGNV
jgi:hypothetical protein